MMSPTAAIPMKTIGPVKIIGNEVTTEVNVPLATYEAPLWPSTNRGARVTREAGGINATIIKDCMTRSVLFEATHPAYALKVISELQSRKIELAKIVASTSRHAQFLDMHEQIVGNLLFLRFEFFTGDASGHNMVTKASDHLMTWILANYPELTYVSISGNFCTDKKASAVNGILGRGKYVFSESLIPRRLCQQGLKTTPEKIVDLNIKKNLIGTLLAGTVRSANAHFANILLGFYLATGQDAANIVEGSQGIVHAEMRNDHLYFSVTLPNIIVGTIGNGKDLPFVMQNLAALGCTEKREAGVNARRLAIIIAATVLCGELSLLAAQTNPGELMQSHLKLERK